MLTPKQRAHLRSIAHSLKPVVQIGKNGLDDDVVANIDEAFRTRELLKVKVLETAPDSARDIGDALAERLEETRLVQVIGRTIVLYRPHPEKPVIVLPR